MNNINNIKDAIEYLSQIEKKLRDKRVAITIDNCAFYIKSNKEIFDAVSKVMELKDNQFIYWRTAFERLNSNYRKIELVSNIRDDLSDDKIVIEQLKYHKYSKEEELELLEQIKKGSLIAKQKFIYNNLLLVYKLARDYKNVNVDIMELFDEGYFALEKAVSKYDPEKGTFSTYAFHWIRCILNRRFADIRNHIHVPELVELKNNYIKLTIVKHYTKYGSCPTNKELEELYDISKEDLENYSLINENVLSLNSKIVDGEDELMIFVKGNLNTEDEVLNEINKEEINKLLESSKLSEREIDILYTLNTSLDVSSIDYLKKKYNVSKQRIYKIRDKAYKKIRENPQTRFFKN